MTDNSYVVLGRLARPHSIRGEIRVEYYADSPQLLDKPLLLRAGNGEPRTVRIASRRMWRDHVIIRLEGVEDRTAAELLRGQELLIAEADFPDADDELYIHDILGLPVLLADGTLVGELEDVLFPAGQEVWTIRAPAGHEILLPAVPEFVDSIDLEAEEIRITPPRGLLELYEPTPGPDKTAGPKRGRRKAAGKTSTPA